MKLLDLKLRMMVLWIWIPIALCASALFIFTEPGGLEKMISKAEVLGVWWGIIGAIMLLGPLVMAFLSITLKDRANRLTNRILSIIFAALMLAELSVRFLEPSVHQILFVGSAVVAAAYLIFYSWKWPVKET